jgi:hypothetical protein
MKRRRQGKRKMGKETNNYCSLSPHLHFLKKPSLHTKRKKSIPDVLD